MRELCQPAEALVTRPREKSSLGDEILVLMNQTGKFLTDLSRVRPHCQRSHSSKCLHSLMSSPVTLLGSSLALQHTQGDASAPLRIPCSWMNPQESHITQSWLLAWELVLKTGTGLNPEPNSCPYPAHPSDALWCTRTAGGGV